MNLKSESKNKRLKVLNEREINKIYAILKLMKSEYSSTFDLDNNFLEYFDGLQILESKLFFILMLGFFKRTLRFFHFDLSSVEPEIKFIFEKYFSDYQMGDLKNQVNVKPSIVGDFSTYLNSKLQSLDDSISRTNERILSGDNEHFESYSDREEGWILHYESLSDPGINNQIFNKYGKIGLVELFREIDSKTNFLDCFEHILTTHAKSKVDKDLLIASIIGFATNLGLSKMEECSPYSYSELKSTRGHFLRAQNLIQASETIINETSNYYDLGETSHSSNDRQKFLSAVDTFNAVRSPKYYGLGKRLSVISLNANYLPLGLKVVSSNEYGGNYILELLLMNSSNIQAALNRAEGYHQLVKSINISNEGKNIVENMIINFNSSILSKFIIEKSKQEKP